MKNFFRNGLLLIMGLFLITCSKDPIIFNHDICQDFEYGIDDCWFSGGPLYSYGGLQYKAPYFNPNDPNEFVFIEVDYNLNYKNLNIYNISTLEKKYLADNISDANQPKWNNENKILFKANNQIYIVNSSGDSSKQVTFTGLNVDPEWITFNSICYRDNNNLTGVFLDLQTLNSNIVEGKQLTIADVSTSLMIAATDGGADNPNITISPVDTLKWSIITNNTFNSGKDRIMCIQWHPNNEDVYYTKWSNGLYRTNIYTKKEECILEGCQSKWYKYFNISPDGQKIIAERVDATFQNTGSVCSISSTSSIVLMNIDVTNEVTILPTPE